jgi:hypothetical protein
MFSKQKKDQPDIPTGLFFCGDERNHRLLAQALPKSSQLFATKKAPPIWVEPFFGGDERI